jgi:hypothetical protein
MDRFIDTIEWIAAGFVGIVRAQHFHRVILRNTLNYAIPDTFDIGRMLLGILIFWGIAATSLSRRPHHRRSGLGQCRPEIPALDRRVRNAGAAVRGERCRPGRCSTRCAAPTTTTSHLRDAHADLAVLRRRLGRRRLRRALIAIRTYRLIFHPGDIHDAKGKDGGVGRMSTDAVAVLGFVALFALMLLRVPVGMAMGLVGVCGFGYLTASRRR